MRKLNIMVGMLHAMAVADGTHAIIDDPVPSDPGWRRVRRIQRSGYPRLLGPNYSNKVPVLKRGRRRTLALKLAQVVDWHDARANLYGCHPCPKCGEVRDRAAFKRAHGLTIECGACNDKRPVREQIG